MSINTVYLNDKTLPQYTSETLHFSTIKPLQSQNKNMFVYFANSIHVIKLDTLQISLKQSTNIIGPKTDPYGTPQVTLYSFKTHRSMYMISVEPG